MDELQTQETLGTPETQDNSTQNHTPQEGQAPKNPYAGTKHKVKLDNQEIEVPYEQLVADFQMKTASQKRFDQASQMKKEVDGFISNLKSGDLKQLKEILTPQQIRDFAEQELLEYIKYEQMSDEQKELLSTRQERDILKKEREDLEKEQQKQALELTRQQATQELDTEIAQAIKSLKEANGIDPKEPIEPWFVDHIARIMIAHLEADETATPLPAKLATEHAWKGVEKTVSSYLNTISPQKALAMIPRSLREAIRKADVSDAVTQMHTRVRDTSTSERPKKEKQKFTTDEFFKRLDKRFS